MTSPSSRWPGSPAPGLVGVAKDNLPMEGDVPALACGFAAVEVDRGNR